MRIKLDDNERGAFNYLAGGLITVLALRGLAWVADALGPALTPDGAVLRPFQHGYWGMRNQLVVTSASSGLTERLVLAVVLAVGAAFATALIVTAAARARGRRGGRWGAWCTRIVLLTTLAWTLVAAFHIPATEARIDNGILEVRQWRRLAGDIPLPFTREKRRWARDAVGMIKAEERAQADGRSWIVVLELEATGGAANVPLARSAGIMAGERLDALRDGSAAAALLERELR